MKSKFLSNIRNEINNPFTSILGLAQSLMSGGNLSPDLVSKMGSLIYQEAFSLDFQLKNIFVAADLEAGEASPQVMQVGVVQLIQNLMVTLHHPAGQKGVRLNFHNQLRPTHAKTQMEDDFYFNTDPDKIRLILSNLVHNAIEYSETDSEVDIVAEFINNNLNITVRDYGVGIEEEKLSHIFERFNQMYNDIQHPVRGHGLGLSVTQALLEILQGEVQIESTKGKGSSFRIILPEMLNDGTGNFAIGGDEIFFDTEQSAEEIL
jgi:signal transduction histidine kinase